MRFARRAGTAVLVAMVFLLPLAGPVLAQSVGDRVRVTTAAGTATGTVTEVGESGLRLLLPQGWHWEVTRSDMEQLEVSTMSKRSTWIGLGAGVGAGLVVSLARMAWGPKRTYCGNQSDVGAAIMCNILRARRPPPPSNREIVTTSTMVTGVIGLVAGALVKRDVWATVANGRSGALALDPLVEVRSGPGGRPGASLGTRIRF